MPPQDLRFDDLRLEGISRAGDATWLRVHPPGIAFDVGRGALKLSGAAQVFLSHGHLDHALGLPFVLSQRSRESAGTQVFAPAEVVPPLERFLRAASELEGEPYRYELVALSSGSRIPVGKGLVVEAFTVDHVVPALGFHLWRRRLRLREDLLGLDGPALAALRSQGEAIEIEDEELLLTYCGDTGPRVFELEPRLFRARILVLECTYITAELAEKAHRFGHLWLGDIAARADRFENERIVLHHLSRRHSWAEMRREVERLLPALAPRVLLLGEGE